MSYIMVYISLNDTYFAQSCRDYHLCTSYLVLSMYSHDYIKYLCLVQALNFYARCITGVAVYDAFYFLRYLLHHTSSRAHKHNLVQQHISPLHFLLIIKRKKPLLTRILLDILCVLCLLYTFKIYSIKIHVLPGLLINNSISTHVQSNLV